MARWIKNALVTKQKNLITFECPCSAITKATCKKTEMLIMG